MHVGVARHSLRRAPCQAARVCAHCGFNAVSLAQMAAAIQALQVLPYVFICFRLHLSDCHRMA